MTFATVPAHTRNATESEGFTAKEALAYETNLWFVNRTFTPPSAFTAKVSVPLMSESVKFVLVGSQTQAVGRTSREVI